MTIERQQIVAVLEVVFLEAVFPGAWRVPPTRGCEVVNAPAGRISAPFSFVPTTAAPRPGRGVIVALVPPRA